MLAKEKMTSIGKPVPELPVADVERAQQHYRDVLGFEVGWLYPGKEIGAVSRGDMGPDFFGRESRRLNRLFTGCSLKISTRRIRN
jgi:catechol 2,3-dioxygenase-like lactoylglutathione lyase family enzyme